LDSTSKFYLSPHPRRNHAAVCRDPHPARSLAPRHRGV